MPELGAAMGWGAGAGSGVAVAGVEGTGAGAGAAARAVAARIRNVVTSQPCAMAAAAMLPKARGVIDIVVFIFSFLFALCKLKISFFLACVKLNFAFF